jgi:hypothetical protein
MGQTVQIKDTVTLGDVLVLDTDRSFTGQDGEVATPGDLSVGVPGLLARGLFALDIGIDHVFVQQNAVTVRRPGGWDEASTDLVSALTGSFLRHYGEGDDEEE